MKHRGLLFAALSALAVIGFLGCSDSGMGPEAQPEDVSAVDDLSPALTDAGAPWFGAGRTRGTFLVATREGLVAVSPRGETFLFAASVGQYRNVEVQGTRIFASGGGSLITEYDVSGAVVSTITLPDRIGYPLSFAALPDGNLAIFDCRADSVYFVDGTGAIYQELEMPEISAPLVLQNMNGVVVGNRLIISETGTRKIAAIDLRTFEATIFRDFSTEFSWFADINYKRPFYYVTRARKLQRFTRRGRLRDVAEFEDENLTGFAILGNYAYGVFNFSGEVHRIHLRSGHSRPIADGLDYPLDIELVPVVLEPPVGP